jgi:hypothetical protein
MFMMRAGIGFDEDRREQAHETRQDDEIDAPRPQQINDGLVVASRLGNCL